MLYTHVGEWSFRSESAEIYATKAQDNSWKVYSRIQDSSNFFSLKEETEGETFDAFHAVVLGTVMSYDSGSISIAPMEDWYESDSENWI